METAARYASFALAALLISGCAPLTWVPIPAEEKKMTIDYSFDGQLYVPEMIVVSSMPEAVFQSQGCGRRYGLVAPLIFELVLKPEVGISPPTDSGLVIHNKKMRSYIKNEISNYDKMRHLSFIFNDAKCSDVDGAAFEFGDLKIEGKPIQNASVLIRHTETVRTRLTTFPSGPIK